MKKIILMFLAIMALSMPFSAYAKKVYPDGPLFPVREGGLYGYIDRTGKMIIKTKNRIMLTQLFNITLKLSFEHAAFIFLNSKKVFCTLQLSRVL